MHRLVVVDEEDRVIGIISLSDLLLYLVLRPCGKYLTFLCIWRKKLGIYLSQYDILNLLFQVKMAILIAVRR